MFCLYLCVLVAIVIIELFTIEKRQRPQHKAGKQFFFLEVMEEFGQLFPGRKERKKKKELDFRTQEGPRESQPPPSRPYVVDASTNPHSGSALLSIS